MSRVLRGTANELWLIGTIQRLTEPSPPLPPPDCSEQGIKVIACNFISYSNCAKKYATFFCIVIYTHVRMVWACVCGFNSTVIGSLHLSMAAVHAIYGILINEAAIQKTLKGFPAATIPNWAVAYAKVQRWSRGGLRAGDCKQIGKTPNAFRFAACLPPAAICKILYRFSLSLSLLRSSFYLFLPCICRALLLPSMLTQLHLWKRPAVCQFVCCFAAKENMSKISQGWGGGGGKITKTKENFFFDRLQLANFHAWHSHRHIDSLVICIQAVYGSGTSTWLECVCVVCVCMHLCCVPSAVKFRRDVWECMQTASTTAVGSDFRFHFEKNEIGYIPDSCRVSQR